ncbi:ABC transporter substrate-binding protein [Ferrovibrio sp.]|uniref:ABC transporter substrate-binding protein n=1 Tax=Ferrovibrio sp. TaxID=1917215 RepID=UPI003D113A41
MKFKANALVLGLMWAAVVASTASAQPYDAGASNKEVKIGQTKPYSGPASAYSIGGKTQLRYFDMINANGGVNGRKIVLLSEDDSYSPPKTVEKIRKLVEQDEVLFLASMTGTATNIAVRDYVNGAAVPHLLVGSGSSKFNDPKGYPWSMGFVPNYHREGRIFATYIVKNHPGKKIGILYQNDDSGKDALSGLKEVLAANGRPKDLVIETSYESTDPTVDSQVIAMQAAGAEVIYLFCLPRVTAQVIRKKTDIGYNPALFITNVGSSVATALAPAGLDNAKGVVTAQYLKDPSDAAVQQTDDYKAYKAFAEKWMPEANLNDNSMVQGYVEAQIIQQIVAQAGNNLTRKNILKQSHNLDFVPGMILDGIRIKTSDSDNLMVHQLALSRFDGKKWVPFSEVIGSD